jgi:hypothetical protein
LLYQKIDGSFKSGQKLDSVRAWLSSSCGSSCSKTEDQKIEKFRSANVDNVMHEPAAKRSKRGLIFLHQECEHKASLFTNRSNISDSEVSDVLGEPCIRLQPSVKCEASCVNTSMQELKDLNTSPDNFLHSDCLEEDTFFSVPMPLNGPTALGNDMTHMSDNETTFGNVLLEMSQATTRGNESISDACFTLECEEETLSQQGEDNQVN